MVSGIAIRESYVSVRPVSPITLVVIGGAVIVVLIVAALHPPSRRFDPARSAGGPSTRLCPEPVHGESVPNDGTCWLTPVDPATAPSGSSPTDPSSDPPATGPAEVAPTTSPTRPARTSPARTSPAQTRPAQTRPAGGAVATVDCPDVKNHLPPVPAAARSEVTANLAELQQQIDEADARLADLTAHPVDDPNYVQNTVLGPLKDRRIATLDRITIAIGRVAAPPVNLAARAPCTLNG